MYSRPLATRMEGMRETPTRMKRGVPLGRAGDFSSLLPQGLGNMPNVPGQGALALGQNTTPLEQAATQNNLGMNQMRALAALTSASPDVLPSQSQTAGQATALKGLPLNARDLFKLMTRSTPTAEAAETAVRVRSHRKATSPRGRAEAALAQKVNDTLDALRQKTDNKVDVSIGKLAAQFESGSKGIAAIGYDRHGGTSYGKYQISSRAGTMRKFIEYCRTEAPDIAEKLEKCGGSMNTGGRRGKMPTTWIDIAKEQPERFEALQDKFIRTSHFEPAIRAITEKTGMELDEMPTALQEVVFSTAVQHGPDGASKIISRAMNQVGQAKLDPDTNGPESLTKARENLIRKIYDNRSGQFRSSTESVRAAVKSRLRQEMSLALSMLRQEQVT